MIKSKILILDDDAAFVESTAEILNKNGYEAVCARAGLEELSRIKHEVPDLVIMDVIIAGRAEGVDLARCMCEDAALKEIPIIITAAPGYTALADKTANTCIKTVLENRPRFRSKTVAT